MTRKGKVRKPRKDADASKRKKPRGMTGEGGGCIRRRALRNKGTGKPAKQRLDSRHPEKGSKIRATFLQEERRGKEGAVEYGWTEPTRKKKKVLSAGGNLLAGGCVQGEEGRKNEEASDGGKVGRKILQGATAGIIWVLNVKARVLKKDLGSLREEKVAHSR